MALAPIQAQALTPIDILRQQQAQQQPGLSPVTGPGMAPAAQPASGAPMTVPMASPGPIQSAAAPAPDPTQQISSEQSQLQAPAGSMDDPRLADQKHHGFRKALDIMAAIGMGAFTFNPVVGAATYNMMSQTPLRHFNAGVENQNALHQERIKSLQAQSGVAEQGARTQQAEATTAQIRQNLPMRQRAAEIQKTLTDAWHSGKMSPQEFKDYATRQLSVDPASQFLPPTAIDDIMKMKPSAPLFKMNGKAIEPLQYQGTTYGPTPAQGEPPEIGAARQVALDSINQSTEHEVNADNRKAGVAAEKQAQAFANQEHLAHDKDVSKRYDTALDADMRLGRMETSYQKAVKGDQQAMLALLTDHIGMTLGMQKGARITKDILNEAQASQPWLAGLAAHFDNRGYLSGAVLSSEQMKQMVGLGYEARENAWKTAKDASTMYGTQPPQGADQVYSKRDPSYRVFNGGGGQGGPQGGGKAVAPEGTIINVKGHRQIKRGGAWVPYQGK